MVLVGLHHVGNRSPRAAASCSWIEGGSAAAPKLLLPASVRLLVLSLLVTGCVADPSFTPSPTVDPAPYVPPWQITPAGTYRVTTSFDVARGDLVADPGALTRTLDAYVNHPGLAMLASAATTSDPALAVLHADLPAALQNGLEGWLDEAVNPTGRLAILGIAYSVKLSFEKFDVESELVINRGIARHHLIAIDFPAYQKRFELGGEAGEVIEGMPAITAEGNSLELGEHALAIGIGAYAWDAVDAQVANLGGIRGALGAGTQCTYVALEVATKCIGATCVGHLGELQQLCERALDHIVDIGRDEASAFRFTSLRLRGSAGMLDANKDHVMDGLFGGSWAAQATAGDKTIELAPRFE